MYGLDLFSGIGGITLGLEPWVTPAAYCEIDPYVRGVLLSRMADGLLPAAPVWDDVRTLSGTDIAPPIDIIYGGFPCQDISTAGSRAGLGGERSGLYREIVRLADELRPSFLFLENVAAIRGQSHHVVKDLAGYGFDCRWTTLSAAEVGAPHRRDRWWLLAAHPDRVNVWNKQGRGIGTGSEGPAFAYNNGNEKPVGNTDSMRELQPEGGEPVPAGRARHTGWWASEPDVGRVANGVPKRVDRLRALGNAVVPAQARQAFKILAGIP